MAFGGEFILRPRSWRRLARFAGFATVAALSPAAYTRAAREIAVRQIYLTAWKVVPGYLAFSALLSLVRLHQLSRLPDRSAHSGPVSPSMMRSPAGSTDCSRYRRQWN